ncbi:MAG: CDP-diacylglycerol-glycerol-3-phosphate 3-phosphatidyltransferase [candidate division TM6 bacterium GW2011_GWE2_42_60]|nr:MAG: CDP-diacylglycerol-glycerol-3-phosphate 3-phosphatidyltransferase [candidate division TM6 bacterium GW2011_GWE2_42_60]HBY06030.1 CDP-diacylglycerol--glycerol-3-phosphate 3-phosphatidyltransferase [Candidatus Dependentiae bacterium]
MNISLFLTLTRLAASVMLLPFFFYCAPWQSSFLWAVLLDVFVLLLCFTDFLDGRLARLLHIESDAGRVFDPVADKVLVTTMFLILFSAGRVGFGIVILVIVREFIVMGLRELALMQGASVPVVFWGKLKTATQMFFSVFQVVNPCFYGVQGNTRTVFFLVEQLLWWLVVILTVESALNYFLTFRCVTKKSAK